jgi:predicted RNA-binding Zn-ribbon protein involved in translation (DUF1610 family)
MCFYGLQAGIRTWQTLSLFSYFENAVPKRAGMTQQTNKERTAFKHPNCGGVIFQYKLDDVVQFECDQCGERADEIDRLILRGLVIIRRGSSHRPPSEEKKASEPPGKHH